MIGAWAAVGSLAVYFGVFILYPYFFKRSWKTFGLKWRRRWNRVFGTPEDVKYLTFLIEEEWQSKQVEKEKPFVPPVEFIERTPVDNDERNELLFLAAAFRVDQEKMRLLI